MQHGLTIEQREAAWRIAIALDHAPFLYQVRDAVAVHIVDKNGNKRYWNPFDPDRRDVYEVLRWMLFHAEFTMDFADTLGASDMEKFPKAFCEVVVRCALLTFDNLNPRKTDDVHVPADKTGS